MAVAIKYSTDIRWGTSSAGTQSIGKVLSCTRKKTAKAAEIMDEDDELHSLIFHDQRLEFDLEVLATADAVLPDVGSELTVATVTACFVMEASEMWRNNDAVKFSIRVMKSVA